MSIQKKSLISTLKTAEKAKATSLRLARKGMATRANRLKLAANHNQTLLS
jgi:hypothetical protein